MMKRLTIDDISLITNFYKNLDKYDDDFIDNIKSNIENSKIICASIDKKINALIIYNLINNQYYLENFFSLNDDMEEIKSLLSYSINVLRTDERGLNILYDNFPYSDILDKLMIESGFKCNFLNFSRGTENVKFEQVKSNIIINDRSSDVLEYIYKEYVKVIKSEDVYLGRETKRIPKLEDIHMDNANIAVVRDNQNKVIGVAKFSLITDSIFINSLYAEDENVYIDLINLISNLTNRKLEIGLFPVRRDLIDILIKLGFVKIHSDYVIKLS